MRLENARPGHATADIHPTHAHDAHEHEHEHDHFVQFYDDEESLLALVGDYLEAGLRNGEVLLVIATPEHRAGFCEQLARRALDVDGAIAERRLKLLDARETLAKFMVNGMPDWERFRQTLETVLSGLPIAGAVNVRAYGEMVDLLWRDGNPEAAIQLEEHWNDLRRLHSFSLFCAYVMASFYKQLSDMRRVGDLHSHVVERPPLRVDDVERPADAEYATAFAREIAQRKAVERELRSCLRKLRATEAASRLNQANLRDLVERMERATEAKARHAERAAKITSAIAEAVSPQQVHEALVDQTGEALGASSAGLWVVEDDHVSVRLAHSSGYSEAAKAALVQLRLDQPLSLPVLDAIRDQAPKLLSSRAELLHSYPHLSAVSTPGRFYSVVCIPLSVQGHARGGLGFTFEQPGKDDQDRRDLLDSAARYGAQALERLRLLEGEKRSRNDAEVVAHRLGMLSRASRVFAEVGPESGALLQSLVELVCADFADACGVLLRTGPDDQSLEVSAVQHRNSVATQVLRQVSGTLRLRLGVGLTGRVASTGEVVLIKNVEQASLLEIAHPDLREYLMRLAPSSVVLVPMRVRGRVIGVLAAAQDGHRPPFEDADARFLEELAERAAMAVDNSRLYEANEKARRRAEILYALAGTVNQAAALSQVFDAALAALSSALGADRSSILTFDDDDVMRFKAWQGLSDTYRAAVEGHSPWSRDSTDAVPILVADAAKDPAMSPYQAVFEREGIRSLGFIPLVAGGKLLGKFMIYFNAPHAYTEQEHETAVTIANHVAAAILRFRSVIDLQRTVRFNEVFTAMLGHDLRNPLSGMTTSAQVLLKRPEATAFAKPLVRIIRSGERMSRMIDQLLDFTRVRLGTGILIRREKCDVHQVLLEVVDELKAVYPSRAIHVQQQGDCRGEWDADRLAQVFSNLVANAVNHGAENVPVDVRVDGSAPGQLIVQVSSGGTIHADVLPKLFEPMAGSDRRSEKSSGLGLGLYISRQIALAHGGSIQVSSDAALGTAFTVILPRSKEIET